MKTTSFHLLLVSVTGPFIGFSSNSIQEFFTESCRTSAFYQNLSSENQARTLLTLVNEYLSVFSTFISSWMKFGTVNSQEFLSRI
jgi:hypothetical protein